MPLLGAFQIILIIVVRQTYKKNILLSVGAVGATLLI